MNGKEFCGLILNINFNVMENNFFRESNKKNRLTTETLTNNFF